MQSIMEYWTRYGAPGDWQQGPNLSKDFYTEVSMRWPIAGCCMHVRCMLVIRVTCPNRWAAHCGVQPRPAHDSTGLHCGGRAAARCRQGLTFSLIVSRDKGRHLADLHIPLSESIFYGSTPSARAEVLRC